MSGKNFLSLKCDNILCKKVYVNMQHDYKLFLVHAFKLLYSCTELVMCNYMCSFNWKYNLVIEIVVQLETVFNSHVKRPLLVSRDWHYPSYDVILMIYLLLPTLRI